MLPTIRRILYATDLSESARHAVWYAAALGRAHDARITVLHVVPDVVDYMSEQAGVDIEEHFAPDQWEHFNTTVRDTAARAAHQRVTETIRNCMREAPDCPLHDEDVIVRTGNPAQEILEESKKGYDLLVMGTHGRRGLADSILSGNLLGDVMLGSVAGRVVRRCGIPVLTVRLPPEQQPPGQVKDV